MDKLRCKSCNGPVRRDGNYYVCEYCQNKWEIDSANDVFVVDRANAWSALRDNDFERAAELFENIILKDKNNHEAYWGRALSTNGIVYVTDINESKKVPTCNNITESSFIECNDVVKAISVAPNDIAESYKKQAEQIEKIRVEWLNKAQKEPAYDVFISYKDSDRENGLVRTQDSVDAQDLYNALVAEGYKVFFSRISLRDKVSEQFEPYIYNAIKTAKVMIVFGEKPEYFSSVWIKNEWSRFKTRIENGEKHKNSLVVVYKNIDPADLPVVLKSRQCLNANEMTFLQDLTRHIQKVIEATKQEAHIDKITVSAGKIAKKATQISTSTIQTKEIGEGAVAETSIDEKQSLSLLSTFLKAKQWNEAHSIVEEGLFNNPSFVEMLEAKLLVKHKVSKMAELVDAVNSFNSEDFALIEKILGCASKAYSSEFLETLYSSYNSSSENAYNELIKFILPFNFDRRQACIDGAFDNAIKQSRPEVFKTLLTTLATDEVDKYIKYNLDFAYYLPNERLSEGVEFLTNVLEVDEGNVEALERTVYINLHENSPYEHTICNFERLLSYLGGDNNAIKNQVKDALSFFQSSSEIKEGQGEIAKQLLRYYPYDIKELEQLILSLAENLLANSLFKDAEYFASLILSFNKQNADAYFIICLAKAQAKNEEEIPASKTILIGKIPEYTKYLALTSEKRRVECINIANEQKSNVEKRVAEIKKENNSLTLKLKPKFNKQYCGDAISGPIMLVIGILATIFCFSWAFGSDDVPILLFLIGIISLYLIPLIIPGIIVSIMLLRDIKKKNAGLKKRLNENNSDLQQLENLLS